MQICNSDLKIEHTLLITYPRIDGLSSSIPLIATVP